MLNNIRKEITLTFINNGEIGTCNGCIARRGSAFSDVSQVIYLDVAWIEKDYSKMGINNMLKNVKESYCYYCSMDLLDKWRDIIRDTYNKKHLEKINNG